MRLIDADALIDNICGKRLEVERDNTQAET